MKPAPARGVHGIFFGFVGTWATHFRVLPYTAFGHVAPAQAGPVGAFPVESSFRGPRLPWLDRTPEDCGKP